MALPRLLAVGQALNASGYARVMESVMPLLADAFDVVLFAPNHRGPPLRRDGIAIRGSTILGDPYGREELPAVLADVRPDVVLVQVDAEQLPMHAPALAACEARVVAYCPIDWPELSPAVPRALAACAQQVVAYTEYGRRLIAEAFDGPIAVVPHGVDTDRFRPLTRADDGDFVVLNANRNIRRKRIALSLQGFALFAR